MLKEILNGNKVRIGKDYGMLSGKEIRILLLLQCISNSNGYVIITNLNMLSKYMNIKKKTLKININRLIESKKVVVYGDIDDCCNIEIENDNTYELFENIGFIFEMLDLLSDAELKLYCAMTTYLNFKENKNYIYPSMRSLVHSYYTEEELEDETKIIDKERYINRLKNQLIEKGFIQKVAVFYFYQQELKSGYNTTLGYFLKTGQHEVDSNNYNNFIKNEIIKYNESHNNNIALATKDYLIKCKYKNIENYIYHEDDSVDIDNEEKVNELEETEEFKEVEETDIKTKYDVVDIIEEIIEGKVNIKIFDKKYKEFKEYSDGIVWKTIYWDKINIMNLCKRCDTDIHKVNTIFKFIRDNIDETVRILNDREDTYDVKVAADNDTYFDDYVPTKVENGYRKRSIHDIIINLEERISKKENVLEEVNWEDDSFINEM